ncbi:MAG TPA: DUF1294 domain-containing protein [Stenotrophomonas sp.]|nr:DUF1294 domain-containing protein [Stenotrophomonas sp.]
MKRAAASNNARSTRRSPTRPRPTAARVPSRARRLADLGALALVGAHIGLLWLMWLDAALPAWLAGAFTFLALLAFVAYARDKRAARLQARRTPESVLHMLELLGGWPGALLAQRALRHKNRKLSFQWAFWACVVLHEATLCHIWRQAAGS